MITNHSNGFMNINYIYDTAITELINTHQSNMQFAIGYKNRNFLFAKVTDSATQICCGLKSADRIIGLSDYELPGPSARLAPTYVEQDTLVMTGKKLLILDAIPYSENSLFLTNRFPVLNQQSIVVGAAFIGSKITDVNLLRMFQMLKNTHSDVDNSSFVINVQDISLNKSAYPTMSDKELEILWLLARGISTKNIATFLFRSHRTIQDHIEHLKIKHNCDKKSQLVEKAINNGILTYIPQRFLKLSKPL